MAALTIGRLPLPAGWLWARLGELTVEAWMILLKARGSEKGAK
jgi:hypothetical protein